MADEEALHRALRYFAQQVITRYDLPEVLAALCDHAAAVLGAVGAGVMLLDEKERLTYVAASDALVEQVDVMQTTMREGPCWTCSQSGEVVLAGGLEHDDRWPRFRDVAVEAGLRSVACFPMVLDEHGWGTFNVFHDRPVRLGPHDVEAGRLLAEAAAVFLHNANAYGRAMELTGQLERALRSRLVIEQAKGKLAAVHGLEPDAAFDLLRRRARERRQKLHQLARQVMEGTTDLPT